MAEVEVWTDKKDVADYLGTAVEFGGFVCCYVGGEGCARVERENGGERSVC